MKKEEYILFISSIIPLLLSFIVVMNNIDLFFVFPFYIILIISVGVAVFVSIYLKKYLYGMVSILILWFFFSEFWTFLFSLVNLLLLIVLYLLGNFNKKGLTKNLILSSTVLIFYFLLIPYFKWLIAYDFSSNKVKVAFYENVCYNKNNVKRCYSLFNNDYFNYKNNKLQGLCFGNFVGEFCMENNVKNLWEVGENYIQDYQNYYEKESLERFKRIRNEFENKNFYFFNIFDFYKKMIYRKIKTNNYTFMNLYTVELNKNNIIKMGDEIFR